MPAAHAPSHSCALLLPTPGKCPSLPQPCKLPARPLQAAEHVPAVKAVIQKYGVTPAYLERRAKEVWPDFTIGRTLVEAPFSDEDKAARLRFCYAHLQKPLEFWLRVVWIDEASIVLEPAPQRVLGERGTVVVVEDPRKAHHRYGVPHLNFTLAVNAYAGVVHFRLLHNTTGFKGKQYLVSPPRPARTSKWLGLGAQAQLAMGLGVENKAPLPWLRCHICCCPQPWEPLPQIAVV